MCDSAGAFLLVAALLLLAKFCHTSVVAGHKGAYKLLIRLMVVSQLQDVVRSACLRSNWLFWCREEKKAACPECVF